MVPVEAAQTPEILTIKTKKCQEWFLSKINLSSWQQWLTSRAFGMSGSFSNCCLLYRDQIQSQCSRSKCNRLTISGPGMQFLNLVSWRSSLSLTRTSGRACRKFPYAFAASGESRSLGWHGCSNLFKTKILQAVATSKNTDRISVCGVVGAFCVASTKEGIDADGLAEQIVVSKTDTK